MVRGAARLCGNELSDGGSHDLRDHEWVVAGSGGGYFRTGRFLRYGDVPHQNLLVSLANAMGVPIDSFGHPAHCTGPLAELT